MSIEWISHNNKKILYIRYSGLDTKDASEQILKATQILVDTKNKNNLTLSDLRDIYIDQDFINLSKEQGKISKNYTKKAAVIGVEGVKKLFLKTVNTMSENPRVPFSTLEEAKEWLTRED